MSKVWFNGSFIDLGDGDGGGGDALELVSSKEDATNSSSVYMIIPGENDIHSITATGGNRFGAVSKISLGDNELFSSGVEEVYFAGKYASFDLRSWYYTGQALSDYKITSVSGGLVTTGTQYSEDLIDWTPIPGMPTVSFIINTGESVVALAGTNAKDVYISTDGKNFSFNTTLTAQLVRGIASDGNGNVVVVSDSLSRSNCIFYSDDYGETWSVVAQGFPFRAVVYYNGYFWGFGDSSGEINHYVGMSADGSSWAFKPALYTGGYPPARAGNWMMENTLLIDSSKAPEIDMYVNNNNISSPLQMIYDNKLLTVGMGCDTFTLSNHIAASKVNEVDFDGQTFSYSYLSKSIGVRGSEVVVLAGSYGWYTDDLEEFTVFLTGIDSSPLKRIVYGNGLWVAIAGSYSYYSSDGVSWAKGSTNFNPQPRDIAYDEDTGQFIALSTTNYYQSSDGDNWSTVTPSVAPFSWGTYINKVFASGNDIWIAFPGTASATYIYRSDDYGSTWTAHYNGANIATGIGIFDEGDGCFYAASYNGFFSSTDGLIWTQLSSNCGIGQNDLLGAGYFYINKYSNTIYLSNGYISRDGGITWDLPPEYISGGIWNKNDDFFIVKNGDSSLSKVTSLNPIVKSELASYVPADLVRRA